MLLSQVPDHGKRNESRGSISAVFLIVFVPMNRNESLGSTSGVLD